MFTGIFVYLQVDVSFNYLTRTSAILVNVIAIAWMEYGVFFCFPWAFQHLCIMLDLWTYDGVTLMKIYSENLWVGIPRIMLKKEVCFN